MRRLFNPVGCVFSFLVLFAVNGGVVFAAENNNDWYLTLYRAQLSGDKLFETLTLQADLDKKFWFWAIALGKQVHRYSENVSFEVEGQYVDHHGRQDHNEYKAPVFGIGRCQRGLE